MRTPVLFSMTLALATPLAAQSQHKVMFLSGDTLVTIERGARNSCTVKLGDRTLTERQARDICARQERNISFTGNSIMFTGNGGVAMMKLDSIRSRMRLADSMLSGTRLNLLRQQEAMLAQELATRSQAFTTEAAREAFLRSRDASEAGVFGSLLQTQQGSIIGVSVDPRPRETDRWGVYVRGVTPNYPADKAGIQVGDIITQIDGQSLTSGRTERTASDEESLVWLRLSEIVRKLEPGKAVDLEYRRNERNEQTRITPVEDNRWFASALPSGGSGAFSGTFSTAPRAALPWATEPDEPIRWTRGPDGVSVSPTVRATPFFSVGGVIANLELAPMNEKLGAYFGTPRGVLVLSAPEEKNLGLQPGDVITAVDGRNVGTPGELIRVLRTYDRDRQFTMQVMRQKQRQSITTSLP